MSDKGKSLFASRIGTPLEESAAIMRQRRAALQARATALPASSAERAALETEAMGLTARAARPAWQGSNERQNVRRMSRE